MSQEFATETPVRHQNYFTVVLVLSVLVMLPMLYVLFAGPVVWVLDHWPFPDASLEYVEMFVALVYGPLDTLCERLPIFEEFLDWYLAPWSNPNFTY